MCPTPGTHRIHTHADRHRLFFGLREDEPLAPEGLGVDQHAVHVEHRRAVPGHGHAAYVHGFLRPGPLW
jgi:hypothetical protein